MTECARLREDVGQVRQARHAQTGSENRAGGVAFDQAASEIRISTCRPAAPIILTKVSRPGNSILPRMRSEIRGWVTPSSFALRARAPHIPRPFSPRSRSFPKVHRWCLSLSLAIDTSAGEAQVLFLTTVKSELRLAANKKCGPLNKKPFCMNELMHCLAMLGICQLRALEDKSRRTEW